MSFASAFDEALARRGPPAVFLPDREGRWRFEADWTRDCWERAAGLREDVARAVETPSGWTFALLRDHDTGFVNLVLATSPELVATHPRADVRRYEDEDAARAAWTSP